jgi:Ca2+-binding RTX toxin-like protein
MRRRDLALAAAFLVSLVLAPRAGAAVTAHATFVDPPRPFSLDYWSIFASSDGAGDSIVVTCEGESAKVNGSDPIEGPTPCDRVGKITLEGNGGDDTLDATSFPPSFPNFTFIHLSSTMIGGEGNDTLLSGPQVDRLVGGQGDDHLDGGPPERARTSVARAGDIAGFSVGGAIVATMTSVSGQGDDTLASIEQINGSDHADRITGDGQANYLNGLGGPDVLIGGGGPDNLLDGRGKDQISGGAGDDFADVGHGDDRVRGGGGRDVLFGGQDADLLEGGAARDELYGGHEPDRLFGGPGPDRLFGGEGHDALHGGAGRDFETQHGF